MSEVPMCGSCRAKQAAFRCMVCRVNNCMECRRAHILDKAYTFHKLVHIKFVPVEDLQTEVRPPCKTHHDFRLEYFCKDCDLPVCAKCKEGRHKIHSEHVIHGLSDAATQKRQILLRMVQDKEETVLQSLKDLLLSIQQDHEVFLQDFDTQREKLIQHYRQNYNNRVIDFDEKEIDVRRLKEKFSSRYLQQVMYVQERLNRTASCVEEVKFQAMQAKEADILLRFTSLKGRLNNVHGINWLKEKLTVDFSLKSNKMRSFNKDPLPKSEFMQTFSFRVKEELEDVLSFGCILDTKVPTGLSKLKLSAWQCSVSSKDGSRVYVSLGNYLLAYAVDNRNGNERNNARAVTCVNVGDVIKSVSMDTTENVFIATDQAIKSISLTKQPSTVVRIPAQVSAVAVTSLGEFIVALPNERKLQRYTPAGTRIAEYRHREPRKAYRPRGLAVNAVDEIFFVDGESLVTGLDKYGKLKTEFQHHVTQSFARGKMIPVAIASSRQRHLYVVDHGHSGALHLFTEEGNILLTVMIKQMLSVSCLTVDVTGDVWTGSDDGKVRVYRSYMLRSN